MVTTLPIDPLLPLLREALAAHPSAVLQAPPGAGKTTVVPLALLDEPWLGGRKIVMLEPRRLATRAAAHRMAGTLREKVGETVGYRIRRDTRVGPRTRIEVVTEGVLTRMIQSDPSLEGAGLVIFDEFHERNLHGDLGLALTLEGRAVLRPDLRLLVMSATLDGAPIAALLDGAPVITSEGKSYRVETRYRPRRPEQWVEPAVVSVIREALEADEGDVLVFLPGAAEIRRVESMLRAEVAFLPSSFILHLAPLYGALSQADQDAAIRPSSPGHRKVVLATSIAETSLTIEGVRVVIDSGLARVPRFSPRSGMTRLQTQRVSRASADQRRGRAGRTAPGVCYRLWAEAEDAGLVPFAAPEILEADLASLALELAVAGISGPGRLRWLDPPPAAAYAQARELLTELEALDAEGCITPHGRRMAEFGLHPRLAHMLLRARELGQGGIACDLAALLSERDILRGDGGPPDADVRLRLERVRTSPVSGEARALREQLGTGAEGDIDSAGALLALAYPDRVALRRPEGRRYLLRNGQGATLTHSQALERSEWIVAAELDGAARDARIFLAAPVAREEVERLFAAQIVREDGIEWDAASRAVVVRRRERLGAITLRESPLRDPDPGAVATALEGAIRAEGIARLPWSEGARKLRARLAFLHVHDATWPDVADAALDARLDEWLGPRLRGVRKWEEIGRIDLGGALLDLLDWKQRAELDQLAPTHLEVPSGSRIPVDYSEPGPVLAVRLQEVFGWTETPRLLKGRVPVTLHLLSPARRPVQVTRDLAGFWKTTYFEVRKDLKGRYPRHYWPDDPLVATPTRRVRPS